MIPQDFITEWRTHAPWTQDVQVEQDLVISRALVEIFRVPELVDALAFRGGTALYKLHLRPAARYSEDIDLVQVRPEPIGPTLDRLKAVLDPWLGVPRRDQKEGRVNLVYRMQAEGPSALPMAAEYYEADSPPLTRAMVLGGAQLCVLFDADWQNAMVALKSGKASDAARLISAEMGIRGYAVSAKDLTDALKTAIAAVMVPDGFAVSAAEPDMSLDASPKPAEVADVLELIRQYKRTLEPHLPVPAELPAPFDKLPRTFVESVKGGIYGEMWNPKMAATMVDAINGLMALLHFARRFAFFHETETRT